MIWKGTKAELITFIKDLNEKYKTIKFNFQVSRRAIAFLDAMLYKDENNNIQTTISQTYRPTSILTREIRILKISKEQHCI